MVIQRAHGTPLARHHLLDDGRLVTVRRAVPSDAPALSLLDADVARGHGIVALDDHGAIVGHAGLASSVVVVDSWSESGLAAVLAREA